MCSMHFKVSKVKKYISYLKKTVIIFQISDVKFFLLTQRQFSFFTRYTPHSFETVYLVQFMFSSIQIILCDIKHTLN